MFELYVYFTLLQRSSRCTGVSELMVLIWWRGREFPYEFMGASECMTLKVCVSTTSAHVQSCPTSAAEPIIIQQRDFAEITT